MCEGIGILMVVTFSVLAVTIILFMTNRIRADLVGVLALLFLVIFGVLDPNEALAGFSNSVVIMIAALFIVGAGIMRTGLAKIAGNLLLRWSGNSEKRLFILLLLIVAGVGAFMSNTGTVAIMLPIVISIAISIKADTSKFLIPLSFVASLSGLLTLIASPPNLIVSEMLVESGYTGLSFFQITPIGVIGIVVGIIYLFLVRNILLPKRNNNKLLNDNQLSIKELIENYRLEKTIHRIRVLEDSPMVEKSLSELKIPLKYQLCILKIDHRGEGKSLLPITYQEMAGPKSVIHANDILYIQGSKDKIEKFVRDYKLSTEIEQSKEKELVSSQMGIAEVLLTPNSSFINKTIANVHFREKFNLNVIGINRKGNYILQNMSSLPLRFGDALLVQGSWQDIELLANESKDVVVVGQPKEQASQVAASGKAPIAGGIMLLMILLMVFEVFPTVISVIIGAILMVITGCLRNMDDAYGQLNWESIVLIATMLPMATALEKTGGMVLITEGMIRVVGDYGPLGVLIGLYLITMIFGQFISNTATAALFAPIAMNVALNMGYSPYPFLIAVAVGASMSFITPVASPTNALVMTAGGYKFTDFVKIGVPMQIVMFIVMMAIIPVFFPF